MEVHWDNWSALILITLVTRVMGWEQSRLPFKTKQKTPLK